ncbi:hypothetical protein [Amycolatopsis sp. WAC 04182]|uniref:hypothetical protein n=1 Tax=Amycolatopsis sp. WAC 04182 TaxID=2203198 RepID=UPI000F76B9E8|nr:hypothetical protein [Amycolatopsis sp. WAC 04182]
METLNLWFAEFGIDVDSDETTAAQDLRAPTWLARALKVPGPEKPTVVIHCVPTTSAPWTLCASA